MRSKPTSTAKLACGMQGLHIGSRGSTVEIFGVTIKAGSRDEHPDEYGLAHFVEHTIFKGTGHRRSAHIIKRMESVGGELNAYTTKEETVIYSIFPTGNLARAVELIADLIIDSRFPENELEKEREVVADEIDSYLDSPSEAIFDDFEDMIFAESPLGHNILGNRESLRRFDSQACRNFVSRNYRADNMVAFYSGPRSENVVFAMVDRYFSGLSQSFVRQETPTAVPAVRDSFDFLRCLSTHQAHCVIGSRTSSYLDQNRYAAALLTNIVGGPGMNSLLNIALRERRGLVYNVEASTSLFSDCGLMTVYFGCDAEDNRRCCQLVYDTFARLANYLTDKRLEAAKKQYLGQLVVASENRENNVLAAARSLLWRGDIILPEQTRDIICSVTHNDIIEACRPLLSPSILTFSPILQKNK